MKEGHLKMRHKMTFDAKSIGKGGEKLSFYNSQVSFLPYKFKNHALKGGIEDAKNQLFSGR